ncbi:MAG: polymerase sigma factor, sigma-70 family [Mucilaginibacter sp.]|jgi:RNA polymerase sigma-70 factor (family 1)|nr:polymerase sigma factor, sigma-70 family [Mucilaginibacter sp.]
MNSDIDLWNAIREDDECAFAALFDRYWSNLYNASYKYLKDREISEEIVHDIFLSLWNRRKELEVTSFQNFLLKAVRYQIYNRMRAVKLSVVFMGDNTYEDYSWENNKGVNNIKEQEFEQEVFEHLNQLPKRCQEIFKLSRIYNLTNQEIATRLGISKRSVENQIAISTKHLRSCLKYIASIIMLLLFK